MIREGLEINCKGSNTQKNLQKRGAAAAEEI